MIWVVGRSVRGGGKVFLRSTYMANDALELYQIGKFLKNHDKYFLNGTPRQRGNDNSRIQDWEGETDGLCARSAELALPRL